MLSNLGKDYNGYGAVNNEIYKKDDFPKLAAIFHSQHHCQLYGSRPGNIKEDRVMIVRCKHHQKNYTVIMNSILQNRDLSLEAKGLLCELLSFPLDWVIHKESLYRTTNGKYKINRIFKELKEYGYATCQNIREKGRIADREWIIYEDPEKKDFLTTGLSTLRKTSHEINQPLQSNNNIIQSNKTTTNGLSDHEILKTEKKKAEQFGVQQKQFEEFWSHRPGRGKGSNSKALALKQWNRRLREGVDPLKLINAMKFYKMCCQQDGIINTRGTLQVSTFLGEGEHYETDWEWKATIEVGKKVKTPEDLKAEKDREEEMERQSEAAYLEKMKDYNKTHPLGVGNRL